LRPLYYLFKMALVIPLNLFRKDVPGGDNWEEP